MITVRVTEYVPTRHVDQSSKPPHTTATPTPMRLRPKRACFYTWKVISSDASAVGASRTHWSHDSALEVAGIVLLRSRSMKPSNDCTRPWTSASRSWPLSTAVAS